MGTLQVTYMLQWCHTLPFSVPFFSLPPFKGRKVMMSLFIIISSYFVCLTASSGAHTAGHTHTHTVRITHTRFPPGLASRTALLIQRKEGQLGPGPFIIHTPKALTAVFRDVAVLSSQKTSLPHPDWTYCEYWAVLEVQLPAVSTTLEIY